jgi:hypothetical protein
MATIKVISRQTGNDSGDGETRDGIAYGTGLQPHIMVLTGLLLFLLGQLIDSGLFTRVGGPSWQALLLECHLNGLFLIFLGLIWSRFSLPAHWRNRLYGIILCGTWLKWIISLVTAGVADGLSVPMLAADRIDLNLQQLFFDISLICLSCALMVVTLYLSFALRRRGVEANRAG